MTNEVMIRFCVGQKGSRRAIVEMWVDAQESEEIISECFSSNPELTLAQIFDDEGFVIQYERR